MSDTILSGVGNVDRALGVRERPKRQKGGWGGKFDQTAFFTRPMTDAAGDPDPEAGWVCWGSYTHRHWKIKRGYTFLERFGPLPNDTGEEDEVGNIIPWKTPWTWFLQQPGAAALVPHTQVATYQWWSSKNIEQDTDLVVPDPRKLFTQTAGHKVGVTRCPQCKHRPFVSVDGDGEGERAWSDHMVINHAWTRAEIMTYAEKAGINLEGAILPPEVIDFGEVTPSAASYACDFEGCTWSPDPAKKNPDAALRSHRWAAHKPLVVEEA